MIHCLHTRLDEQPVYVTKDGSEIRELMHPQHHGVSAQSLAEAVVRPGAWTRLHRHVRSEELYHVLSGSAHLFLGEQRLSLRRGDTVAIAPGTPHRLHNCGRVPLRLLCMCAPAYAHDDTELLEP